MSTNDANLIFLDPHHLDRQHLESRTTGPRRHQLYSVFLNKRSSLPCLQEDDDLNDRNDSRRRALTSILALFAWRCGDDDRKSESGSEEGCAELQGVPAWATSPSLGPSAGVSSLASSTGWKLPSRNDSSWPGIPILRRWVRKPFT